MLARGQMHSSPPTTSCVTGRNTYSVLSYWDTVKHSIRIVKSVVTFASFFAIIWTMFIKNLKIDKTKNLLVLQTEIFGKNLKINMNWKLHTMEWNLKIETHQTNGKIGNEYRHQNAWDKRKNKLIRSIMRQWLLIKVRNDT